MRIELLNYLVIFVCTQMYEKQLNYMQADLKLNICYEVSFQRQSYVIG